MAAVLAAIPVSAAKKKTQPEPFATVAGTVFRDPGFAVPGVKVTVEPAQPEKNGVKFKKAEAVTNFRGEWAVRVPPVPMQYSVNVKVNGFNEQQKTVAIEGEQRQEVNFVLEEKRGSAGEKQ